MPWWVLQFRRTEKAHPPDPHANPLAQPTAPKPPTPPPPRTSLLEHPRLHTGPCRQFCRTEQAWSFTLPGNSLCSLDSDSNLRVAPFCLQCSASAGPPPSPHCCPWPVRQWSYGARRRCPRRHPCAPHGAPGPPQVAVSPRRPSRRHVGRPLPGGGRDGRVVRPKRRPRRRRARARIPSMPGVSTAISTPRPVPNTRALRLGGGLDATLGVSGG